MSTMTTRNVKNLDSVPAHMAGLYVSMLRDARVEFAEMEWNHRPQMPTVYAREYDTECDVGESWSEDVFSEVLP